MLSPEADARLAERLREAAGDEQEHNILLIHRTLLERSRLGGVDAAFEVLIQDEQERLDGLLRELEQPAPADQIPARLQLVGQALEFISPEDEPLLWAQLLAKAGQYLTAEPRR